MKPYAVAALGGTFDHFHKGHENLLSYAITKADHLVIGVTQDSMTLNKPYSDTIQPYDVRVQTVKDYLKSVSCRSHVSFVKLWDIFGPTLVENDIQALIVSPLTEKGAVIINAVRKNVYDLPKLPIEVCEVATDSRGEAITSTRIREGSINREGVIYATVLKRDFELTNQQKQALKKPLGKLFPNSQRLDIIKHLNPHTPNLAIGDEVSWFVFQHQMPVTVFIFDSLTKRHPTYPAIHTFLDPNSVLVSNNPAGTITREVSEDLKTAIDKKMHIHVHGEEDLTVLPAILLLPLGSHILYGQPDQGLVAVEVTQEKKEWCRQFLTTAKTS